MIRPAILKYAVVRGVRSNTQIYVYAKTRTYSMANKIMSLLLEQRPGQPVWVLKVKDLKQLE